MTERAWHSAKKLFGVLSVLGCLSFWVYPLHAQQHGVWWFTFPYDGANGPVDFSRMAFGNTPEEACAKRSLSELTGPYWDHVWGPINWVGVNPKRTAGGVGCGFRWTQKFSWAPETYPRASEQVVPSYSTCYQMALTRFYNPAVPFPAICPLQACTPEMRDPNGYCLVTTGKNAGKICPFCGNPVNPANGNKFEQEVDLAPAGSSALRFTRYYNGGVPAYDYALGGFWTHNYASRILINGAANQVTYYRGDGKQYKFTLQSGTWVADGDVADRMIGFRDASSNPTAWQYTVAATEDVEIYDASGILTSIQSRSGMTTNLAYTDGSSGATTGNGGYVLDALGNPTTTVLPRGLLIRVTDHFRRSLRFGYDSLFRIVRITDPAGGVTRYAYDAQDYTAAYNLISVTRSDGRQRIYSYNEQGKTGTNLPNALTGITDENGARYGTYRYDQYGRVTESVHDADGSNADRVQLSYDASGTQTTVTDSLGTARTYGFQTIAGVVQNNALSQPAASGTGSTSNATTYDANGNVAWRTDWNANRTNYSYDLARNLETSRTEGLTAAGASTANTRTISTDWHASLRLPVRVAEPLKISSYVYNGDGGVVCGAKVDGVTPVPGVLCSKSIQATTDADGSQGFAATPAGTPRTWRYTYNPHGLVLTADGPRTDVADVTTYTYYADDDPDLGKRGNVATITNAQGHVTSFTAYNAFGQPTTIVDPNGLTTALAYDARQRLVSRSVGVETTSYEYDGVGQLTKVTLPDGSFLVYSYDAAHRLTGMADSLGNKIAYTLDAMGNRTKEDVLDPAGALAQTRSRVYNNFNRLFQEVGAAGQTTEYAYDNQGNVISVKDPLNRVTSNQYDALNRLAQVTDPNLGQTHYGYNGLDALTSVSDPRGLVTGYAVDGLGNLTQQQSPDTGTTTNTYDVAGNLLTQTDAKGQSTTYAYDVLNRATSITYADGTKHTYAYDEGPNALGRLSRITETDSANAVTSELRYAYDPHGRVTSETRTLAGTSYVTAYAYDGAGRLASVTYPSGRSVTYGFDALGRVIGVTTSFEGKEQVVAQNVQYHPFGGVKSYTLGNGQMVARTIDQDGRIAGYTLGNENYAITFDAASRITGIAQTGNPANANSYGYDGLDRLTSAVLPNAAYGYSYDAVGNRISKTTGAATDLYTYSATSNRIASLTPAGSPARSFVFDPNGSTTNDGLNQYVYDARGRMVGATSTAGATAYQVNALGQRVAKSGLQGATLFHYDTRGRLIVETDAQGNLKRELLYLGDIPVAVLQ